jgi:hypothetical protein
MTKKILPGIKSHKNQNITSTISTSYKKTTQKDITPKHSTIIHLYFSNSYIFVKYSLINTLVEISAQGLNLTLYENPK